MNEYIIWVRKCTRQKCYTEMTVWLNIPVFISTLYYPRMEKKIIITVVDIYYALKEATVYAN